MAKILIADDEAEIREILREILESEGHSVVEACDGAEAKSLLETSDIELIISDMQMPNSSGIELLKWVKANDPLPFLLITGFSNLFETKQAFELGANEFLTKPFTRVEIRAAIAKAQEHESKSVSGGDDEKHYCRIPIEDFVSTAGFQVSVYAKLSPTKFVRVAHKGDPIEADRVEAYQAKGVNFLYAKKEEFARVVGFNLELSSKVQNSASIPHRKKLRFLKYTSELVLEHLFVNGMNEAGFKQAHACLDVCVSLISQNDELFKTLEVLNGHSNWLYAHSLGVSIYSVMIGRKLGWKSQSTLFKLAAAGLFHDLGCKEIPQELLLKPRHLMTTEERHTYETHTTRGKDILQSFGSLGEDVIQIVHEHHEEGMGQGYPRRIMKQKIHPLVRIVAVADKFCYLALKSPGADAVPADIAIAKIIVHSQDEIDQKALSALQSLCSMPAPSSNAS